MRKSIQFPQNQSHPDPCSSTLLPGHVLKFTQSSSHHKDRGIICYPQLTYGNSLQCPQQFKLSYGLVNKNSYVYQHQNKNQFKYLSQMKYFTISNNDENKQRGNKKNNRNSMSKSQGQYYNDKTIIINNNHNYNDNDNSINDSINNNENKQDFVKFHRKKGRLSQFMDKNGWMNKVTKIMGNQRDDRGRQLNKKQIHHKIKQLTPRIPYINPSQLTPNTTSQYFFRQSCSISARHKIRQNRNKQADKFTRSIELKRNQIKLRSSLNNYNNNNNNTNNNNNKKNNNMNMNMSLNNKINKQFIEENLDKNSLKLNLGMKLLNINNINKQINNKCQQYQKNVLYCTTARSSKFYQNNHNNNNDCLKINITRNQNRIKNVYKNQINQINNKEDQQYQKTLQNWYRTTCSSKWTYNKKVDSEMSEIQNQNKKCLNNQNLSQ